MFEFGRGMTGDTSGRVLARYDPLQRADSVVFGPLRNSLSFPYIIRRQACSSCSIRVSRIASGDSQILGDTEEGLYARASFYRMKRQEQRATELLRISIEERPTSDALRMEYLRGWFGMLAHGKAAPEIVEVANGLHEPAATILRAAQLAASGDWQKVADLDDELAAVPWRHLWYGEAMELRANWRARVMSPDRKRRFGDEAIQLIDRVAITNATLNLYGLRARAGFTAERPDVVIESVSNYARMAAGMVRSGVVPLESMRGDAATLRDILNQTEKLPGADLTRVAEVRAEISVLAPTS